VNIAALYRLGPDGSLQPTAIDSGTAAAGGLGTGVVVNMGNDTILPSGTVTQYIYANCGFPLPIGRCAVDWGAMKAAVAAGQK
jgi:hypothetical protein